jgi:hypothetical protein
MRLIMGLKCDAICGGKRACPSGVDVACPLPCIQRVFTESWHKRWRGIGSGGRYLKEVLPRQPYAVKVLKAGYRARSGVSIKRVIYAVQMSLGS